LFGAGELELRTAQATHRTWLDAHCWVDQVHGWLGGQMQLYDRLSRTDLWHRAEEMGKREEILGSCAYS
jgi:hypothetical protein